MDAPPDKSALIFGKKAAERKPSAKAKQQGHSYGAEFLGDHRLRAKVKAAAKRAGIEHPEEITPYVLRHSFGTNYPSEDVFEIARTMGHQDIRTTMAYRQSQPEKVRESLNKLAGVRHKSGTNKKATTVKPASAKGIRKTGKSLRS